MAIDINGYNETFKAFTNFATSMVRGQGDRNSIARITDGINNISEGPLAGRTITVAKNDSIRGFFKWFRADDAKIANNATRDIFKRAIIDMFGGESKIPEAVKKAMIMGDYNKGKPLTARRILLVKAAIDNSNTTETRIASLDVEKFKSPAVEQVASKLGFVKSEMPKLARAAHYYMEAKGVDEETALREVAKPRSNANRLMEYGGRFMSNAEDFADGLRLMDTFEKWHADLGEAAAKMRENSSEEKCDFSQANTISKHNASPHAVNKQARLTMEKFVFEELAANPSANLKETNAEAIFGFKNNQASSIIGRGFGDSCLNTYGGIPPEKRTVVFKTLNLFCSLSTKSSDHKIPARDRYLTSGYIKQVLGRIMRHLDEILALNATGKLNAKNVITTCYPDMVAANKTGNFDRRAIEDFLDNISYELSLDEDEDGKYCDISSGQLTALMESTGCTLEEGAESLRNNKPIPMPQYVSEAQQSIGEFGTIHGGRKELESDLYRPSNYSVVGGQQDILPPDAGFGFNFPGEGRFITNGANRGNIAKVGDKVLKLCGPVHEKQACNVMLMLSQSGLGVLRGGLKTNNVLSNEHSAVDFTLSRNDETGSVTIKYTSPAELPFSFSWTSTVDVEGKITTTPCEFSSVK